MSEKPPKRETASGESNDSTESSRLHEKYMSFLRKIQDRLSPEEIEEFIVLNAESLRLEESSRTDELTGLLNRRGFHEEVHLLEAIFAREKQREQVEVPTALLAIDLDGFKQVNDTCGHAGGDRCLELIAERVQGALRESDVFARVGGDEFSIFLSQDNEEGAIKVAEKVRLVIEGAVTEAMHAEYPMYTGQLSASIGVVPINGLGAIEGKVATAEEALKYADYASYVVKASGKMGELTLDVAREIDADGQYERDFLSGKTLPR